MGEHNQQENEMPGPLNGIKIVDFSIALAGPWAGGILADQGASVTKIKAASKRAISVSVGVVVVTSNT